MKTKKLTSIILSAVLAATSLFCASATTVNTEDKLTEQASSPAQVEYKAEATEAEAKAAETRQANETEAAVEKAPKAAASSEFSRSVNAPADAGKTAVKKSKASVQTAAAQTIVYSYVVATDKKIAAFDGEISYPSNFTLVADDITYYDGDTITIDGKTAAPNVVDNAENPNGVFRFNVTYKQDVFDFSEPKALVTLKFNVEGDYNSSDIQTKINDFYNVENVKEKNVSFRYDELINNETVASGQFNKGNPGEYVYLITYNYTLDSSEKTLTVVYTTDETSAKTIAEKKSPSLKSVTYSYSISEDGITTSDNYKINVNIKREKRLYPVIVDGEDYGEFAFNDIVTINRDEEVSFVINDKVVHVGKEFSFRVGGSTEIETREPEQTPDTYALIERVGYNVESATVELELLTTGNLSDSADFSRLGVAFSTQPLEEDVIKNDVSKANYKVGKTVVGENGVLVYTSKVTKPNVSGQYQFIYNPYFANNEVINSKTLYFYAYIVDADGTVTVSEDCAEVPIASLTA